MTELAETQDKTKRETAEDSGEERQKDILENLFGLVKELEKKRKTRVFPFLLMPMELREDLVENVYSILEEQQYKGTTNLDVLVTSHGGDIHSAYHLSKLLRRYASSKLSFIVPRYAKSAATVLIFGGDEIIFGPTSAMGPLDPQIPLPREKRGEDEGIGRFSPLAIRPTLDLIAEEHEKGHTILVEKLSSSLPEALVLGQHLKELEVAQHYVSRLLTSRMFKGKKNASSRAAEIGEKLVSGYPSHGCCIDYGEAVELGLNVVMSPEDEWQIIWKIWKQADLFMREGAEKAGVQRTASHDILGV